MRRIYKFSLLAVAASFSLGLSAQVRMRDFFASAPDSLFSLLSKNNRLDCIDFMENNIAARVKNLLDQNSEMKVLTEDYLMMEMSPKGRVELLLLNDSVICMISTCKGPAEDSRVAFYNERWEKIEMAAPSPTVDDFIQDVPDSLKLDAESVRRMLEDLPLIGVTVEPQGKKLTYILQISELPKRERKVATRLIRPLTYVWDGAFKQE